METKHTPETLKETFITGLSAVFKIAGYRKTFFSVWVTIWPIYISVVGVAIFMALGINPYKGIIEVKTLMLNFLPGILGFTIAGYSLMVGFIQAGMLDKITEPSRDSNFSLYQKMSSTFAVNVILQAIALIVAYLVHFIVFFDTESKLGSEYLAWIKVAINYIGFLLLTYWFFISLFMVIQIVLNIFSFSQLHHYFVNKQKVDANREKLSKNTDT